MQNKNQTMGVLFVRLAVITMGLGLGLAPGVGQAEQKQATRLPSVVSCPLGSVTTSFQPGLSNRFQDVAVASSASYGTCVSLLGEPVAWATALEHHSRRGQSCGLVRTGEPSDLSVQWNTGERSELSFTLYAVDVQGVLTVETYNGVVMSGKYEGATAVRTVTYVNTDFTGGCLSQEGITQAHGLSTLTLTTL
jgi:hypothetical protein